MSLTISTARSLLITGQQNTLIHPSARHRNAVPTSIAFFGSSSFSVPFLEMLLSQGYTVNVVTQPDRPQGRGYEHHETLIKNQAEHHHLPLYDGPINEQLVAWWQMHDLTPDCGVIASFGAIIPPHVLSAPPKGFINVHPSLLPRWRGPSPVQWAILNGETETGVTIILMDDKVDHGPILAGQKLAIAPTETTPVLKQRLAELGTQLLAETLPAWIAGSLTPAPQDHSNATWSKLLQRADGHLQWDHDAQELERRVRALQPWPGCWSVWKRRGQPLLLKWSVAGVSAQHADQPPGTVLPCSQQTLDVACGKQTVLSLATIHQEGRKPIDVRSFLRGHRDIVGSMLE